MAQSRYTADGAGGWWDHIHEVYENADTQTSQPLIGFRSDKSNMYMYYIRNCVLTFRAKLRLTTK